MLTPKQREATRNQANRILRPPLISDSDKRLLAQRALALLADLEAALEENTALSKCPRCGEPDDGLFNRQTDNHGPFCDSCGWPEGLDLTGAHQALPLGYRCEAHEGDVADGRCVCCEAVQVADLTAENAALKELLHTALDHPAIPRNLGKAWCAETRALLAAETAEPHPHDWH